MSINKSNAKLLFGLVALGFGASIIANATNENECIVS